MKRPQHIHFVGIKGVGMAPLAIIAKEAGIDVSGCDMGEEYITDEELKSTGITPLVGFTVDHLQNVDLVITTGAHGGFKNPEVIGAKEKHIPVLTQGEAVGEFMKGEILNRTHLKGISVAGSHGKTTTTAILATLLRKNGMDPSYVIGTGVIPSLGNSGHYGQGSHFIAEADEYATEPTEDKTPKFLWQHPSIAIITNIELDHPDLYPSLASIQDAFLKFSRNVLDGLLILNGDDMSTPFLLKSYTGKYYTFGKNEENTFQIIDIKQNEKKTEFHIKKNGNDLGIFTLNVAGEHNIYNAVAAIIVAQEVGINADNISEALLTFTGSKRRLEYLGQLKTGGYLYDDYAHHPTEIQKTLHALRQLYPYGKIICAFQPHTYSRTKVLFKDFVNSFADANTVLIVDIYPSLRESPDPTVSSRQLAEQVAKIHDDVQFLPTLADVVEYIGQRKPTADTILVTMGAGDIYKIHPILLANT